VSSEELEQVSQITLGVHAVEHSPDGVVVVDPDGWIVFANRSMHVLAGADTDLVGRNVDDLVPDAARPRHGRLRGAFATSPTQRPMGSGMELTLRRFDGSEVPVEISLSPFEQSDLYVVAAVRDVTERRESEQRLSTAHQQLALASERERIGRDLHDVVLQRLYGTGLTVQAIAASVGDETADRLGTIVDDIDRIISEVRTIVFTLASAGDRTSLGQELADVVAQSSRVLGFTPSLRLNGPVESVLSDEARIEMMASLREALGNVARHAAAHQAEIEIVVDGDRLVLTVTDDGVGPPLARVTSGHGLVNMRARAELLGGTCALSVGDGRGARLTWSVPY
jgi:PAS domain S-box-containing protein